MSHVLFNSQVFPNGLTEIFSIVAVFKMKKENNNNLFFGIIDDSKPYCTVGIKEEGITINREGKKEKIGTDLIGDLYDDKFHKIQVFFDKSNAVVLVDCIQVARIPFPPLSG